MSTISSMLFNVDLSLLSVGHNFIVIIFLSHRAWHRVTNKSAQRRPRCALFLFVITDADLMPRRGERTPGDVEPAIARE